MKLDDLKSLKARVISNQMQPSDVKSIASFIDGLVQVEFNQADGLGDIANHVCKELPEGFRLSLCMENGAAWIDLTDANGDRADLNNSGRSSLAEQIKEGVMRAKSQE